MPPFQPVDPRVRFPDLEEEILASWRAGDVFHRSLEQRRGGPLWVFYEGPPTANGMPGAHHIEARVFKDLFPITDVHENFSLDFKKYTLGEPKYSVEECIERDMTYSAPLKATLVLTVFERTREIGMLRAVGMTRRQTRRMIRHEAVVTALIGASLGIPFGTALAALFGRAIGGVPFVMPWRTIGVFVIAAIVVGLIAAIFPARRASRLNVLEALQYE